MNKKKFIIILPSLNGGGAEKVTLSLLENIDNNYYECKLVLINDKGPLKPNINKENIINLNISRLRFALPSILKNIRKLNPDIIFSTFPHTTLPILILRKLLPKNIVIIAREPNMISPSLGSTKFPLLFKYLYKLLIPTADKIIVNSRAMYEDFHKKGVIRDKIELIHNPIDEFKIRNVTKFNRHPGKGLRLVGMGRLVYQKGFDRLLPILKKVDNVHLTILGEGIEYNNLLKIIEDLDIKEKVTFKGYIKNSASYLAAADYFILPSRWEGLPNSVLEALVLGTPVITFKEIEGLLDIIPFTINNKLTLCSDEKDMESFLKRLPLREDYKKIDLRKNLLTKFNTPKQYSNKISNIIRELEY